MKTLLLSFFVVVTCSFHLSAGVKEAVAALESGDYETARKEFLPLAEQGDARSMISLGLLYHQGHGVKQDYDKAMDWYLKAFAKGNGDAYSNIGVMYRDGLGVKTNLSVSYALFWITYWRGLGTEETQYRVGRNVAKITDMMKPEEIEQSLKMNEEYVIKYVERRGKLSEVEAALKYSKEGHPVKGLGDLQSSTGKRESFEIHYELRAPKDLKLDAMTSIELVTDEGSAGTRLGLMKKTNDASFVIISDSTLIQNEQRRAVIVAADNQPAQVFRLNIPQQPKVVDWSQWQRPDYTEKKDASWSFMRDLKSGDRSTNLPADCFELRYKIEKWEGSH